MSAGFIKQRQDYVFLNIFVFKDSLDVMKRAFELGTQYGTRRQKKEMLAWSKKRKRQVRREDLIGYICGRNPPPRISHSRVFVERGSPRLQSPRSEHSSLHHHHGGVSSEMQPFCDALALQGR